MNSEHLNGVPERNIRDYDGQINKIYGDNKIILSDFMPQILYKHA